MKTKITILLTLSFVLAGCQTVPESVQEANTKRLEQVSNITQLLADARTAEPQVKIDINLPPGTFNVPEAGWKLATVEVRDSLDMIGVTALHQTDWQISENVAVTVARVGAPLIGFLGGQYFTNQMHSSNTRMMSNIAGGSFGVATQGIEKAGQFTVLQAPTE